MHTLKHIIVSCAFLFVAFACKPKSDSSSDPTQSADVTSHDSSITIYKTLKDLPKCDKSSDQLVAYVAAEKSLFICEKSKWAQTTTTETKQVVVQTTVSDRWREIWKDHVLSVAYVETHYENASCIQYESGTGFVVANDLVVTNGHVAPATSGTNGDSCGVMQLVEARVWYPKDAKGDTQHNVPGPSWRALEIDRSIEKKNDLVLLKVETGDRKPLTLSTVDTAPDHLTGSGTKLGDEILNMGYSGGTTFVHFAPGKINAIQNTLDNGGNGFLASLVQEGLIEEGKEVYEYDLVSGAGSSGGPVFNLDGKVIAINFAGNTKDADTEFGYAVVVKALRDLLAQARAFEPVCVDSPAVTCP